MKYTDSDVRPILDRKINGTDCTEDESAIIKMYLKQHPPTDWFTPNEPFIKEIALTFPIEYGEAYIELDDYIKYG